MGQTVATVLVYDNLDAGDYTLWLDNRAVARGVHVDDGRVLRAHALGHLKAR